MLKLIGYLFIFIKKIIRRFYILISSYLFKSIGKNVIFDPFGDYSYSTITIENDVFIGNGAVFSASKESGITIGNKIMFGPNVTIMGGDHNTTTVGRYMFDVHEKIPDNEKKVKIEDDVWIGTGSVILKGVTIKKGAIVAAGSVVINDVDEYSIVGGVPAKYLKMRFTKEEIIRHEQILNIK